MTSLHQAGQAAAPGGDLSRFHLLAQSPRAGMSLCGVLLSQSWLRGEQQCSCNGEML